MSEWHETAADLLSEGLDLCVRARDMEAPDTSLAFAHSIRHGSRVI